MRRQGKREAVKRGIGKGILLWTVAFGLMGIAGGNGLSSRPQVLEYAKLEVRNDIKKSTVRLREREPRNVAVE